MFSFDGHSLSAALITLTSWAWPERFKWFQDRAEILVRELSRGPGSLWNEIVDSSPSISDHPEYEWEAEVRLGDELCLPERAFLRSRKRKMRAAFAELLEVPIHEVDERDIPIVAIAASGGGKCYNYVSSDVSIPNFHSRLSCHGQYIWSPKGGPGNGHTQLYIVYLGNIR